MDINSKIFLAGHTGMVGSSLFRQLLSLGINKNQIITRTRKELDLTNQLAVRNFFYDQKPDQVYLAAAKVGGIYANNTYPADFIFQNLMIQTNVIHSAFLSGVKRLLFLGSSCIYPKEADQPMKETALLSGVLESTNEPYAIAKIAGIKTCESFNRQFSNSHGINYRSVMPTNLYGPGDDYHTLNSHVIPGLIKKFYHAKITRKQNVNVWGSGEQMREFLFVDDMAKACVFIMNLDNEIYNEHIKNTLSHINIGFGKDVSINYLAKTIASVVGYSGNISFDTSKPDGPKKKLIDSSLIRKLGWRPKIELLPGMKITYKDFLANHT